MRVGPVRHGGEAALGELIGEPTMTLSWALYSKASRAENRDEALRKTSDGLIRMLILLAMPVFLGVAAISGTVMAVVFGEEWVAAGPVVAILAVARLLQAHLSMLPALLGVSG